jgi:hypothetical protein
MKGSPGSSSGSGSKVAGLHEPELTFPSEPVSVSSAHPKEGTMKNPSLSGALLLALLSAIAFAFVGCASSKLTSTPQPTSTANTPTKEYEWHDMSTGKFYGSSMQTTAQAQQAQQTSQQ